MRKYIKRPQQSSLLDKKENTDIKYISIFKMTTKKEVN